MLEKESYICFSILEVDTIKQILMKEKTEERTSEEREDFWKQSSAAEFSSKGINTKTVPLVKHSGLFSK